MTPPRHAVFSVGGYRPDVFGIGRFVPDYVDALAGAGWTVDVRVPYPYYPTWKVDRSLPRLAAEHDGRVQVTRYAPFVPRRQNTVSRALHEASIGWHALRYAFADTRSAHIVVAASPPLLGAAATVALARRRGVPTLVLAYDLVTDVAADAFGFAAKIPGRIMRGVETSMYAAASAVIALSDEMAARIRKLSGRDADVIRIWADDELCHLDHARAARQCRAQLGMADGQRLIGFAGSFGKKQHLGAVAAALRALPGDYSAVFVGAGPDRAALDGARILEPLPAADLHGFLSACDLSVVIAWTEHAGSLFPSKVANILAAGSPILAITRADTELARLIERDQLGVVCPSLDPGAIRDAACRAAAAGRDPARRARCRAFAEQHFDRTRAMARFLDVVERTTGGATRAP